MGLKETLAKQTGLSLINTVLSVGFGLISFFIIARLLAREDIAIIGISAGFLALLNPLLIAPESILFRNYADFNKKFHEYSSAFLTFWFFRTLVVMLAVLAGAVFFFYTKNSFLLSVYIIGAGLAINFNMLQAAIQEIFFVEFKQHTILKLNILYYSIFLLLLGVVFFKRELLVYLIILAGMSIIFGVAWALLLFRKFDFKPVFNLKKNLGLIKEIVSSVVLWTHLTGSALQIIYRADVFILSFFVSSFVTGNYTIALMFSTLFMIVPQVLQKMCLTGLARSTGTESDSKMTSSFIKYVFFLSAIQMIGYYFFGRWVLSFIAPANIEEVFQLGFFILIGVNLFNLVRPLHSYCVARSDVKKLFLEVYLVGAVFTAVAYYLAAVMGGAIGAAQANILVYCVMAVLLVVFVVREQKFRFSFEWITSEEREMITYLYGKMFSKSKIQP